MNRAGTDNQTLLDNRMFEGFEQRTVRTAEAEIHAVVGGSGPPLLLIHGYPQTHVAWHGVAPDLAAEFTVVAPDLRGYGNSRLLRDPADCAAYSKRAMASDQIELMRQLGFDRFAVVGHDRGGRVAYRLALDHPESVSALVSLTVIPTLDMWNRVDMGFALGAYHWFLFAQPHDLPERLLASDPDFYLDWTLKKMTRSHDRLSNAAVAEYRKSFGRAEVRHAIMQDYRAGATFDRDDDAADIAAGRRIRCPLHVLWEAGRFEDVETPIDTWRRWADDVTGNSIECGHLMPEEAPGEVLAEIVPFLRRHATMPLIRKDQQ